MIKRFVIAVLLALAISAPAHAYKFASGSYLGNAVDDRQIDISSTTTPSVADFTPAAVYVKCDGATDAVWRTSAMAGDLSYTPAVSSTGAANLIQELNANGFVVGSDSQVNPTGGTVTCWYWAIAAGTDNDVAVGSYAGNATDNTDITISPAFQPEVVFIQRSASSSGQMVFNPSGTDATCGIAAQSCAADRVQAFNADGFEVGQNILVNQTGTYYYLAIKAVAGSTAAGNFTGDTNDNRQITSLSFQPQWLVIKGNSTTVGACARFKDHSGDDSVLFSASASAANQIEDFLVNGFEVGTASCANENTVTMYWYALKEVPAVALPPARRIIRYQ